MKFATSLAITAPLLLGSLVACDDHDERGDHDGHEACETMAEGPSLAVVAAAPGSSAAPAVSSDHKRYDIRLPVSAPSLGEGSGVGSGDGSGDGSGIGSGVGSGAGEYGFEGTLSLPIAEAGAYTLYFDQEAQVALYAANGTEVALGSTEMPVADCSDSLHHGLTFTLAVGTYTLRIGSSLVENIRLVIEPAAGDGDRKH